MARGKTKQVSSKASSEVQPQSDVATSAVSVMEPSAREPVIQKPKTSAKLSMFESEMLMEWATS